MSKVIQDQIRKIQNADMSHFDEETNSYFIPQKKEIRVEQDNCYLIHLRGVAFSNQTVNINWNNGNSPKHPYMKVDISNIIGRMIKVVGVRYDPIMKLDSAEFWSGWLSLDDIEVLERL